MNAVKKNSPLYNALNTWLGQSVPWAHRGHLTTCLWMVVALIQAALADWSEDCLYLSLDTSLFWDECLTGAVRLLGIGQPLMLEQMNRLKITPFKSMNLGPGVCWR